MPSICILYGFGEGPRVSRRFRKRLERTGHTITSKPELADVIITHSGGHLLMPSKIKALAVMHIAPFYWPGKSWFRCMGRKLYDDLRIHRREGELRFWADKTFWNFAYALKMPANFRMIAAIIKSRSWPYGEKTTVVRPRHDSFCIPDPSVMPFKRPPAFVALPGHHDDCWRDPEPYVDLLQSKYL